MSDRFAGRVRARDGWGLVLALAPALLFLPAVLAPPVNHDVAAILSFSQRWLGGERLYTDLIDVNPPLIFVLNLIPAGLASWTKLDAIEALRICIFGYGAFAGWLAFRVRDRASEGVAERLFVDVLPALFLLAAGYDFGQREHLMALGALPYLLCAARRATGERPRGRVAAALLASVAFALKPHFLAIPALVEFGVIAERGFRRSRTSLRDPIPWIMGALWLAYLASLPVLFPDFLGSVVPLVWNFYLDLGGLSPWRVLLLPRMACAICLLAPLLWIAFRRSPRLPGSPSLGLPLMLGVSALGAVGAAVAQHKGWSYHILPIELFASACAGVLACRWLDRSGASSSARTLRRIAAVCAGLFALYALVSREAPWREIGYSRGAVAGLTRLISEQIAPGERVLVLSPGIYPIYPALNYAGVRSSSRTMNMWPLQGAYRQCSSDGRRYREASEMGRPEFFVYRTVAEDFAKAPPAAVVVDRQPGILWCGEEFDFVAYFIRNPLFAQIWSHYRLSAEWDRYRVYIRKD